AERTPKKAVSNRAEHTSAITATSKTRLGTISGRRRHRSSPPAGRRIRAGRGGRLIQRRARFRKLVYDSFRQIKKQKAEDDVNGEKLDAFDPVGFAVAADLKQDVNRSDDGEDFRPRQREVHRLTKQIGA